MISIKYGLVSWILGLFKAASLFSFTFTLFMTLGSFEISVYFSSQSSKL